MIYHISYHIIWVFLKMLCSPKPNGFADHYPYEMAICLGIYPIFRQTHIYNVCIINVPYIYIYYNILPHITINGYRIGGKFLLTPSICENREN